MRSTVDALHALTLLVVAGTFREEDLLEQQRVIAGLAEAMRGLQNTLNNIIDTVNDLNDRVRRLEAEREQSSLPLSDVVSEGGMHMPKNCPGLPELPEGHVPDDRVRRDDSLGPEEADDLASSEDDRITEFEGVVTDDELANLIWAQRIMKARAMVAGWGLKHPEPEDLTPFI
jgi:hypothetical protein